jgi:hypothetical protein
MTTPDDLPNPSKEREPDEVSQTTGEGQTSTTARGEDLREDQRSDDADVARPDVGQVTEPTNEPDPGGLPDESQGPP